MKSSAGNGQRIFKVLSCLLLRSVSAAFWLLIVAPAQGLGQDAPAPSQLEDLSLKKTRKPSIIESMSRSEDVIEVTVGRSRTYVLDSDFDWGEDSDEVTPSVSISDPGIAEIVILGTRGIRLIGLRVGDTDLTITTGTGEVVSLRIHVVVDLPLIQARMLQFFPDAEIRVGQLGQKLIVEGQARDAVQVQR
ncbi:MAG: pilus assembly protein N-terminal domain-containing protein, partial [Planctomycetaceae bacterium]